ncbi:MAG: anti-sigma factor [Phycisphaerales bacterium]|nr:anti-sigma factor [Phycisphaerales bacterium]
MIPLDARERERLVELLADERLDQLDLEDRAELESLLTRDAGNTTLDDVVGDLLRAVDEPTGGEMPPDVRDRLVATGRALVGEAPPSTPSFDVWRPLLVAACVIVAGAAVLIAVTAVRARQIQLDEARATLVAMTERAEENQALLADARQRASELRIALDAQGASLDEERARVARAEADRIELAQKLADATSALNIAELTIARYEEPADPELLRDGRRKLLEVPDTFRVAWSPFDLPDAPAEQQGVQGDVVWNDELQQGYLRFVGLEPNDPRTEQYQVWVIDERGMEQKVSGGVFNATADGEVIVPIDPAIDVGRVALFAVTIEHPGGTWVPDLKRRVVYAPRNEG